MNNIKTRVSNSGFSRGATRFEPGIEVLQTFALPLGYGTIFNFSLKESDSKGFEPLLPP